MGSPIILPYQSNTYHAQEMDIPWLYKELGMSGGSGGWNPAKELTPRYDQMTFAQVLASCQEFKRVQAEKCHCWIWAPPLFLVHAHKVAWEMGHEVKQIYTWVKTTDGLKRTQKGLKIFTKAMLEIAMQVIRAFGMTGKPFPRTGFGYWGKGCTEFLLQTSNDPSFHCLNGSRESNVFFAPSEGHSVKPDIAYETIRRNSPGPRVSLFQRRHREGFDCWGNQLGVKCG